MTVHRVVVKHAGVSGSGNREGVREYTKVYIVVTDKTDGMSTAANAPGLPGMFTHYEFHDEQDVGALLHKMSPRLVESGDGKNIWEISCHFTSQHGDPEQNQPELLPGKPPEINWGLAHYQVFPQTDNLGKAYHTTAGDPFDPGPSKDEPHLVLNVTRYQEDYPVLTYFNITNWVNDDVFLGFDVGVVKFNGAPADLIWAEGQKYYRVHYEFEMNPELWTPTLFLDAGPGYLAVGGDYSSYTHADDSEGNYSTRLIMLNGADGQRIDPKVDDPGWVSYEHYKMTPLTPEFGWIADYL